MKPDNEILKSFNLKKESDSDTVCLTFNYPVLEESDDIRQAELISELLFQIFDEYPETVFDIIVDVRNLQDENEGVALKSQAIYKGITKHHQTNKIAIIGPHEVVPFYMKFVMRLIQTTNRNIKWFTKEEKARMWLCE